MVITDLWVSYFQWFPCLPISAGTPAPRPEFAFLRDFSIPYPPPTLPVIAGLGKLTPVPARELQGLYGHEGAEKVWSCLDPHLPVQVVPELGLACSRQTARITNLQLTSYLHPLGIAAVLRFRLSAGEGLDGFQLARLLNNIERNRLITSRSHKFRQSRNVVQLLSLVRDTFASQVFAEPPRFRFPERPFCVVSLDFDCGLDLTALRDGPPAPRIELLSTVERQTGNQHSAWPELENLCFVDAGRTSRVNAPSGWILGSKSGMAIHIPDGGDAAHARRARMCDHRNVVKLLSFYRLYQAFLAEAGAAPLEVPRPLLQHALDALDLMRVKYSRWWIRWGSMRLRLEQPVKSAIGRYSLDRLNPPDQRTDPAAPPDPDRHPTVFISYSHDSDQHMTRVREFAAKLMAGGIDCKLDQWEQSPPEGWDRMMLRELRQRDFVLVICTGAYRRRFEGDEEPGVGQGANFEGFVITADIRSSDLKNKRYLPIVFEETDRANVPILLRSSNVFDVSSGSGFEDLYRVLTNQPRIIKPLLGKLKSLPVLH
ncbi:MAG: TIR domain-containing protein [Bryobacterales bacterium]|nr:TIR domain-containing protein [Bryobacterales bacterium]